MATNEEIFEKDPIIQDSHSILLWSRDILRLMEKAREDERNRFTSLQKAHNTALEALIDYDDGNGCLEDCVDAIKRWVKHQEKENQRLREIFPLCICKAAHSRECVRHREEMLMRVLKKEGEHDK